MGGVSTRREWMFVALTAIAATVLAQIPYALGYLLAREGTEYTGLLVNVEDVTYLVAMEQGFRGSWGYRILFTTEPHSPALIYGFYLLLGHISRTLNIDLITTWNLARVAADLVLFLVTFGFISAFLCDSIQKRIAYLLALFGSGFDWGLFPFERPEITGGAPIDFRIPDSHLFFTALTYPHAAIGTAMILAEFWLWLEARRRCDWRFSIAAGIVCLGIGVIYPFLIYLIAGVLIAHWLYLTWSSRRIRKRDLSYLIVIFAFPVPLYAYYASVLLKDPVFRTWEAQSLLFSPNPLHYLLAYGVMLLLAAPVVRYDFAEKLFRDERTIDWTFLWIWIGVVALLLYAPLNAQRRFIQGIQVPLAILATGGLVGIVLPRLLRTSLVRLLISHRGYALDGIQRMLIVVFLLFMSIGNWVVFLRLVAVTSIEQPDGLFRPQREIEAAEWLRESTFPEEAVLSDYVTGAYIPVRAGNTVFVGQRYETSRFEDKLAAVHSFFQASTDDAWRKSLLRQYNVRFVYAGERERNLGGFDPGAVDYLERVYANSQVSIYAFVESK